MNGQNYDSETEKKKRAEELLKYAVGGRQLEISLFWQRSLFFWGFIGAAFVAYGALTRDGDQELRLAIACFGVVCSVAWTLANRGSKYWQQSWEKKVERAEKIVLGEQLFGRFESVVPQNPWVRARYFSVTSSPSP